MKFQYFSVDKWLPKVLLTVLLALSATFSNAQLTGAELYNNNCSACHRIDQDLVGPALGGILERRDEAWLIKWIRNSQAVIASGDQYAVDLYNKWNKVAMPAYDWTDDEIKSVLAYVKEQEAVVAAKAADGGGAAGVVVAVDGRRQQGQRAGHRQGAQHPRARGALRQGRGLSDPGDADGDDGNPDPLHRRDAVQRGAPRSPDQGHSHRRQTRSEHALPHQRGQTGPDWRSGYSVGQ